MLLLPSSSRSSYFLGMKKNDLAPRSWPTEWSCTLARVQRTQPIPIGNVTQRRSSVFLLVPVVDLIVVRAASAAHDSRTDLVHVVEPNSEPGQWAKYGIFLSLSS